jgi:hypothetical protein
MSTYPEKPSELLMWCNAHQPIWQTNAAAIGLSSTQTANFKAAIMGYSAKANAVVAAKEAYRVAVQQADLAARVMRLTTGDTVAVIRAFADTSADPTAVYSLAQIPQRAEPTPAGPPAQPNKVTATLDTATGNLDLKWKATNPGSGTSYIVRRKLPGATSFTILGTATGKKFTDTTLPAGVTGVQYTVQGTRSGETGPESTVIVVNFGHAGPGGTLSIESVEETPRVSAKLAA